MINRYTRPEMGAIWELQNKFSIWKEIEILACEAQAELGKAGITKEEAKWIRDHADFTVERIDEIEKVKLEIVIDDGQVDGVIANIRENAETGHPGDGRIFIIPVLESIRIRSEPGSEGQ